MTSDAIEAKFRELIEQHRADDERKPRVCPTQVGVASSRQCHVCGSARLLTPRTAPNIRSRDALRLLAGTKLNFVC